MAQKKKASVSSVASKSTKTAKSAASTRTKPAAAKKAASKKPVVKRAAATKATKVSATKKTAAQPAKSVKSAKAKTTVKPAAKAVAKKTAAKPATSPSTAKAAPKTVTAKAKAAAKASTKSKIAAAAKKVAARKAAAVKSAAAAARAKKAPVKAGERPLKAVAAAAATTAKRSSAPVTPKKVEAPKKPVNVRHGFKMNEHVVYPAHGVGQIVGIEEQEIAGITLELFVITFEKDKMTLRVPTSKVDSLRKLSNENIVDKAMHTLKGRARIKRTMWSRRAQEYENKINSGDLIAIAEVVRDLYRSESQPEQSYSERQLYEAALDRMAREIAAVEDLDERGATQRITDVLSKSAKGRRLAEEKAEEEAAAKDGDAAAA